MIYKRPHCLQAVDRPASTYWIHLSEAQRKSSNMKSAVVFCVLFFVALTVARPDGEHYTDRYDNVNLDEILSNKKVLENYVKCILDQGKCTPDGTELKGHIKDALETECAKCNERQKDGTRKVIKHLVNHEDAYWKELSAKYDPDRKFTAKYEKELREVIA